MNFLHFWPSKIHANLTGVVSSLSPPRCRMCFDRYRRTAAPCHASFPLSQDELAASGSFFGNTLFCRLSSWVKTKALNSHHRRRLPFPDHLTSTLYCYKNIISNLATLSITQPCLYFTSSLVKAQHHRSFTRRSCSFSSLSYIHRHPLLGTTTRTVMK
jgi:hypothetical protein